MSTKIKFILFIIIVILVVAGLGFVLNKTAGGKVGKLDTFTQCLADSGAKFYGTFWCSHCRAQKKMFGNSAKLLPYIECSTKDGQGQLDICKENNIEGYPTWVFADGSRLSGEVPLNILLEKTNCPLPQEE